MIETSFVILIARWRLFRKPVGADKENITSYILAGVAQHNYLQRTEKAFYCPCAFVDSKDNGEFRSGEWRQIVHGDAGCFMPCGRYRGSHYENNLIKMRDYLKDYVNSDIGSLPWQSNHVQRNGRVSDGLIVKIIFKMLKISENKIQKKNIESKIYKLMQHLLPIYDVKFVYEYVFNTSEYL